MKEQITTSKIMLDEYVITASNGKHYDDLAPKTIYPYVANWEGQIRTLHKNHNPHCYYSKGMHSFIPFKDYDSVVRFESEHDVNIRRCNNYFPDEAGR